MATTAWHAGPLTANAGPGNYEGYVAVIPPPPPSTGPGTHGQPLGQGTMWFTSGNFYEGMWSNGRYHGKGILRTATFEQRDYRPRHHELQGQGNQT
ncbi:hypothetical protein CFD26_106105 [Aspergillus turcosus]|uniref:MORN repeat-containing protein 5 n=1 Tax=Aspergillus turcosus TaxID=1245748 RepID=A0A3R7ILA6_9EURO|nr:hypothetical protein CFD26_106105 [Aspergillus turcosus]